MSVQTLLRWSVVGLWRTPLGCAAVVAAGALAPGLWALSALYLPMFSPPSGPYIAGCAFVAAALGTATATHMLSGVPWQLGATTEWNRFLAEILVLQFVLVLFEALAIVPALVAQVAPLQPQLGWGLALTNLHWGGLALVLLRLPLSGGAPAIATITLGWWVPSTLNAPEGLLQGLHRCVDVSPYLEPTGAPVETLAGWLVNLTPAGILWVAATLLAYQETSSR